MQNSSNFTEFQAHSYASTASSLSGDMIDPDQWQKGQERRQALLEQSHYIAEQLEAEGIKAYIEQDLTIFGLHSKGIRKMENFRNIQFLPIMAKKNRSSILKTLEWYLNKNPNARACTLTSGVRCGLKELPERCRWMHRKVSKCNSMRWMKELGARFIFRTTELGEICPIGDDVSVHPHCHLILVLDSYIARAKWSDLLSKLHDFFGTHFEDCGRLRNVREMVKYCVKPSDLQELTSKQIATLYHAQSGLRLVECLQDLRAEKRQIKESRKKLVRRKGVLKLIPNWVGGMPVEKVPLYMQGRCAEDPVSAQLVAWCAPARVFTPVTEPIFIVHGLRGSDPSRVFEWESVKQMANAIRVHTKTLTVLDKAKNLIEKKERKNENTEKIQKIPIHS